MQTQTYGPEARAEHPRPRSSSASEPIDYPEVQHPDVSLVLSQAAYDKYAADTQARRSARLRLRAGRADPADESVVRCGLPFTQAATDELGKKVVTNIVAVGALVAVSGVLPADAVRDAVVSRVPARFKELNEQAYEPGTAAGRGGRRRCWRPRLASRTA